MDNTATADSAETTPVNDSVSVDADQSFILAIDKSATETSFDAVGDIIHYTILVDNNGNTSLTGITVSDPLLTNEAPTVGIDGFNIGDTDKDNELDPTETWTYTGSYTITQDDLDAGKVDNTATADSVETTPVNDSVSVDADQSFILAIDKSATETSFNAVGDIIHYTILVDNNGNTSLTVITVSDPLLTNEAPTLGIDGFNIGDTDKDNELDPTETWTYTGSYTITQDDLDAGKVDNTATADSAETTPVNDSVSVDADQSFILAIDKSATETSFDSVGDIIHYTILVDNNGNTSLTGITISDPLLSNEAPTLGADNIHNIGDIDNDGELDPTETWTYTGSYTITQDDLDAGKVDNTATADSAETAPVNDSVPSTLTSPSSWPSTSRLLKVVLTRWATLSTTPSWSTTTATPA